MFHLSYMGLQYFTCLAQITYYFTVELKTKTVFHCYLCCVTIHQFRIVY